MTATKTFPGGSDDFRAAILAIIVPGSLKTGINPISPLKYVDFRLFQLYKSYSTLTVP